MLFVGSTVIALVIVAIVLVLIRVIPPAETPRAASPPPNYRSHALEAARWGCPSSTTLWVILGLSDGRVTDHARAALTGEVHGRHSAT